VVEAVPHVGQRGGLVLALLLLALDGEHVRGLGRAVVDGHAILAGDDLGVAGLGLQLEPHAAVAGQPQPALGALGERGDRAAGEGAGGEQPVGERDPRGDAVDGGRVDRVEDGAVERLRVGLGVRVERRLGEAGGEDQRDHGGQDGDNACGGGGSEVSHGEGPSSDGDACSRRRV
jgi:hypothetical protein